MSTTREEVAKLLAEFGIIDAEAFTQFVMLSRDIENDLTRLKPAEITKVRESHF